MPRSAPTLSVAQLLVLRTAASRPDRMVLPLPEGVRVRGATQQRLLVGLLRAGLAEEVPVDDDALCWRKNGGGQRFGLRVTSHGVAEVDGSGSRQGGGVDVRLTRELRPETDSESIDGRTAGDPDAAKLMDAGHDDPKVGADHGPAAAHDVPAPTAPCPRGKLGRVLDALSAAGGATLPEIVALTGWQPHTARAALTGLRKRGFAVELGTDGAGRRAYHARQRRPS